MDVINNEYQLAAALPQQVEPTKSMTALAPVLIRQCSVTRLTEVRIGRPEPAIRVCSLLSAVRPFIQTTGYPQPTRRSLRPVTACGQLKTILLTASRVTASVTEKKYLPIFQRDLLSPRQSGSSCYLTFFCPLKFFDQPVFNCDRLGSGALMSSDP